MGFWDKLGESVGSGVNDYANAYRKSKDMDDRELFGKYKDEKNGVRKAAYRVELENRINERNQNNN